MDLSSYFAHPSMTFQSAEDVNFSGNGITAIGLRAFECVLQRNTSLKALNLSGNPIGDEGAKVPLSITPMYLFLCKRESETLLSYALDHDENDFSM